MTKKFFSDTIIPTVSLSGVNLIITDLIKEGIEQEIRQTGYPEEAVEMTFLFADTILDVDGIEEENLGILLSLNYLTQYRQTVGLNMWFLRWSNGRSTVCRMRRISSDRM